MRPYSSVKGLWSGLICTCFPDSGTGLGMGKFGKTGPEYPKIMQGHMKSNPKTSAPRLTSDDVYSYAKASLMKKLTDV